MDSQELKNRIFSKRPRYANIYKDLIASLANKGNRKTEYIQFGPIYQIYIYAFFIGVHRNERVSLPSRESTTDFLELGKWKPDSLVHFILMTLFSRNSELGISKWNELEDMEEADIDSFVRIVIKTIEEYANAGFSYLQSRFDEDRNVFNETYVFADILKDVIEETIETE
ncbi:MAG: hypothetical protein HN704_16455 [Bacteroidetes bacterium]|jgi:hypothetical protein|nr:hypothetical protein [Bacteroidota bacterium]MBT6685905.1 hypothetical protein [Bacteroidota bacterium]MBT7144023.1 hypothetical protein [Bacteroidota bacterium]MBT7493190.1 hypothetical protein [Bacteroidota bacterium]